MAVDKVRQIFMQNNNIVYAIYAPSNKAREAVEELIRVDVNQSSLNSGLYPVNKYRFVAVFPDGGYQFWTKYDLLEFKRSPSFPVEVVLSVEDAKVKLAKSRVTMPVKTSCKSLNPKELAFVAYSTRTNIRPKTIPMS